MGNRIKIDFSNRIIEVEGDVDFINGKIDWFVSYMNEKQNSIVVENGAQETDLLQKGLKESDSVKIFGVSQEKLSYIVHIKDGDFRFILQSKRLKGSVAEMQVHLALIYCGVCELLNRESNTKEIRKICDNYKCLDGNFAANLKRDGYFSIERGINSEIVLTMPGRDALQDYIKQLIEVEGRDV